MFPSLATILLSCLLVQGVWIPGQASLVDSIGVCEDSGSSSAMPGGVTGVTYSFLPHPLHRQTVFSLEIFNKVWEQQECKKNTLISPLSITIALAMTAAGARGETLEQLSSILGLPQATMHDLGRTLSSVLAPSRGTDGPNLSSANALWIDESCQLFEDFKSSVTSHYSGEVSAANFKTSAERYVKLINAWVAEKTNGKITDVLSPGSIGVDTRLVLANAIYFKGLWEKQFDPRKTEDGVFQLPTGNITVPMMVSSGKHFIKSFDEFSVLRLPYKRGDDQRSFSMYILLPHDRDGLPELVKSLRNTPELLTSLSTLFVGNEVANARVELPKFKVTYKVEELPKLLRQLGLELPFSSAGDFSGIADGEKDIFLSDIRHKAFVEVNEEGTEAAAATVLAFKGFSLPVSFVADHPFLFIIKEDVSEALVFIGHVANPQETCF